MYRPSNPDLFNYSGLEKPVVGSSSRYEQPCGHFEAEVCSVYDYMEPQGASFDHGTAQSGCHANSPIAAVLVTRNVHRGLGSRRKS